MRQIVEKSMKKNPQRKKLKMRQIEEKNEKEIRKMKKTLGKKKIFQNKEKSMKE